MNASKVLSIGRSGLVALMVAVLAGCGGGDDGGGVAPPPASNFVGTVQEGGGSINSVTINSPPVVTFKLQDSAGHPVLPASLSQVRFALAKYVPGAPDRRLPASPHDLQQPAVHPAPGL